MTHRTNASVDDRIWLLKYHIASLMDILVYCASFTTLSGKFRVAVLKALDDEE